MGVDIWSLIYNETRPWLMDMPYVYDSIIKFGLEKNNMFHQPHFLHDSNILNLATPLTNNILQNVEPNAAVGTVELENLTLHSTLNHGLIIVALDPDRKISDLNRTDNIFVDFVNVNMTYESMKPFCSVSSLGFGKFKS